MGNLLTAVAGAAAIDLIGIPKRPLLRCDSTPGRIQMHLGGVGRNIAENLSLLGIRTELICALGDDDTGRLIVEQCRTRGIGMSHSLMLPGVSSPMYLALNDESGDMQWALSDMEIIEKLKPDHLIRQRDMLGKAALIVLDGNLPADALQYLAEEFSGQPLFADPVSAAKAGKFTPILNRLHTIKLNALEAEVLTNTPVRNSSDMLSAASFLGSRNGIRVFITMGAYGAAWYDSGSKGFQHFEELDQVNTTGAGDAFMAGLVYGTLKNKTMEEMLILAQAVARFSLQVSSAVNPDMNLEALGCSGKPYKGNL